MAVMLNDMHKGYTFGTVRLRHPGAKDADEFIEKARNSKTLHEGLVAPPTNLAAFSEYMSGCASPSDRRLLIFEDSFRRTGRCDKYFSNISEGIFAARISATTCSKGSQGAG